MSLIDMIGFFEDLADEAERQRKEVERKHG
jgi:hypothetical protein